MGYLVGDKGTVSSKAWSPIVVNGVGRWLELDVNRHIWDL